MGAERRASSLGMGCEIKISLGVGFEAGAFLVVNLIAGC